VPVVKTTPLLVGDDEAPVVFAVEVVEVVEATRGLVKVVE
jgi:hypothetical protein